MKRLAIILCATCTALSLHANSIPESPDYKTTLISGIPGPEDFAVASQGGAEILLISSDDRLNPKGTGDIYVLESGKEAARVMPRYNEPGSISFRPHGVDISTTFDGKTILWIITHRSSGEGPAHSILAYKIKDDGLYYQFALDSPLLVSPNDLYALDDGRMYVSNDSSGEGGFAETALSLKKSSVVMYDGKGAWSIVADNLAFANGIYVRGGKAYVAATRQNAVFSFDINTDGSLSNRRVFAKMKGPDNIMPNGGKLVVSAHTRTLALVRHMSNQANPSPSVVYQIDIETGESQVIFADDGNLISAASTAAFVGEELFIGQIVGPTLLWLQPK